jgi:predicted AAA+ superfamily ATPase
VRTRRVWSSEIHYHRQIWNASEIAGSLDICDTSARRYLGTLVGSFTIRSLPVWTENLGKPASSCDPESGSFVFYCPAAVFHDP